MSLNHKRRIFRANAGLLPGRDHALSSLGVMLVAAGAATGVIMTLSLIAGSSQAPARAPASLHVSAAAGRLAVLDGNTLRVGDTVVRLEGVAAPARGSLCHADDHVAVDCGAAAANALASMVRGSAVDCTVHGHDGQGRPEANCVAGGTALNAALVLGGWAKADSADLRQPEAVARGAGRGIWHAGS